MMLMTGDGIKKEECLLKVTDDPPDPRATAGQRNVHLHRATFLNKYLQQKSLCDFIYFFAGDKERGANHALDL